jgi:hypothetical protein
MLENLARDAHLHCPSQCLPQISSVDGGGRAQGCKIKFPDTRFTRNNREAREIRTAIGEQEEHFAIGQRESAQLVLGIGIPEPTSKLRPPVARSGGEERQLAGWQLPRRVPAGARAAVPAGP